MAAAEAGAIPIIDSHFHLYDQTRPQGAPFPFQSNQPPFLPKDFRASALQVGVVGGIKVEASPWVEDNLWVLMMIESEPMITGMVGNLDPTKPEFMEYVDRYRKNKLFLGIRYGNVWPGQDLVSAIRKPEVIDRLRAYATTGLVLEVANPRMDLIEATLRLSEKVPDLRIVLGHLQAMGLPQQPAQFKEFERNLRELRQRGAFVKMSGLYRPRGATRLDAAAWKPVADFLWDIYGEDYLIFSGRSKTTIEILQAYFLAKGRPAAEKYFWQNSIKAFRWIKRDPKQPQLS